MATYYSDLLSSSNSAKVDGFRAPIGAGHGRLRRFRASFNGLITTSDVLRLKTFRSSDRLYDLVVYSNGGSTAGAVNIGLHLTGGNNDGAVIVADLYASALVTSSAIAGVDHFKESGTLTDASRLQPLWVHAAAGGASYTEDPYTSFDLTVTPSTSWTGSNTILTIFGTYTAGD